MAECSLNGLKTLCEKEKLLVISNFSFSDGVFKRLVLQTRENKGLFGKGLSCESEDLVSCYSFFNLSCISVRFFLLCVFRFYWLFDSYFAPTYLSIKLLQFPFLYSFFNLFSRNVHERHSTVGNYASAIRF